MNARKFFQRCKKYLNFKTIYCVISNGFRKGFCPVCNKKTLFFKKAEGLRDNLHCIFCLSIPRQRALFMCLGDTVPDWKNLKIHECSPSGATYRKFKKLSNYTPTQFFNNVLTGKIFKGFRCEDLSKQTFENETFDIVITQDVMEHLLDPLNALKEIERTLKPGGYHIFTVPYYREQKTKIRARFENKSIKYFETPEYHSSPVGDGKSLVATDWGYDLTEIIETQSNMKTTIYTKNNEYFGIEGFFIDVFISKKTK
jgi:SAM-dependent methyltransferase